LLLFIFVKNLLKIKDSFKQKQLKMKEYKLIKQPGTTVRKDQEFEDLLNSYAKMGWRVINTFKHRGFIKALIERDKKEE